jgi:hypothetical protein
MRVHRFVQCGVHGKTVQQIPFPLDVLSKFIRSWTVSLALLQKRVKQQLQKTDL